MLLLLLYVSIVAAVACIPVGGTVVAVSIPVGEAAVGIVAGAAPVDAGIVPVTVGIVAAAAVVDIAVASASVSGGTVVTLEAVLGTEAGVVGVDMLGTAAAVTVAAVAGTLRR